MTVRNATTALKLLLLCPWLVNAVDLFAPDWVNPPNGMPYPPLTASVGDTLTFAWSAGVHDVHIHPSHTCETDGSILVATTADNPTTYEFTAQDGSPNGNILTFVSQVGQQCANGLYMNVTVFSGDPNETPAPAPTDVPATNTTNAPTLGFPPGVNTPPVNATCFVCGNQVDTPIRRDTLITLPSDQGGFFTVSCQEVYEDGLAGEIPAGDICDFVATAMQAQCGCAPSNYTCNICDPIGANDWVVQNQNAEVPVPGQPDRTCGELDVAGRNRTIAPDECSALSLLALLPCGCAPEGFNCSICGENFEVTNFNGTVTLSSDEDTEYTCAELQALGASGALNPTICNEAELSLQSACGCAPISGFANCSICGEGGETLRPETELEFPNQDEAVTCGEIQERGFAGLLSPIQCQAAQLAAALECSCAESGFTCNICGEGQAILSPGFNFTPPTSDQSYNCGELELAGLDGRISPNECTAIRPVATLACGCAPVGFTCSICGDGAAPTNSNKTFVPQDLLTCGEVHAAGIAGELTPTQCNLYSPLALLSCGCEADTSATSPTVAPVAEPVMSMKPSSEASSPIEAMPTEIIPIDGLTPTTSPQEDNSTIPPDTSSNTTEASTPAAGSAGLSTYWIFALSVLALIV